MFILKILETKHSNSFKTICIFSSGILGQDSLLKLVGHFPHLFILTLCTICQYDTLPGDGICVCPTQDPSTIQDQVNMTEFNNDAFLKLLSQLVKKLSRKVITAILHNLQFYQACVFKKSRAEAFFDPHNSHNI